MSGMREGGRGSGGRGWDGGGGGGGDGPKAGDPAEMHHALARQRLLRMRHEFHRLTGIDPSVGDDVRAWQIEHGLEPSGRIRQKDLEVARARPEAAPTQSPPPRAPTAPAAASVSATPPEPDFAGQHGDDLVEEIVGGAKRQEKVDNDDLQTHLEGAGETVEQLGEGSHLVFETDETPWLRLAMAPAILNLVRTGRYSEAAVLLGQQLKVEEVYEAMLFATKHLGLNVVNEWLEGIAGAIPPAEAIKAAILWTYEGLKLIREAHERGDRDNRIRLYGRGFVEGFLWGETGRGQAILSALTEEEKEAVGFGLADGSKTAGRTGLLAADVGRELLRRCGGDEHRVEHMLLDALGKKAGLPGVWSR